MNKTKQQPSKKTLTIIVKWLFITYLIILGLIGIYTLCNSSLKPLNLYQINRETHDLLYSLIKTKYFRMIRMNLNRECQLYARNRICKSKSCTVCRCDEKDIPTKWFKKTDKVIGEMGGVVDIWEKERQRQKKYNYSAYNKQFNWVWHVQDEQNDQGEYFDLDTNIQSFTNYNGSTIWKMVYEQNCFRNNKNNKYNHETICKQQQVFYKVISGLHTSISSHLARFYKNISKDTQTWADLKNSDQFFVNKEEYQRRVLDHPDRVQNLLFIYQIYLHAIKQISPYMLHNYTINSQNILQDLHATQLLHNLSKKFQEYSFQPFDQQLKTFFYPQNPKVQLYQHYIHNISRLMNCVECEKCRLFGKMQTYGIGTALKILLGYNDFYKRNQMVALYNAWNKISMSVDFYYQTVGSPKSQQKDQYQYDIFWFRLFGVIAGALVLFLALIDQFDLRKKIKKMFMRVKFPSERKTQQPKINKPLILKKND